MKGRTKTIGTVLGAVMLTLLVGATIHLAVRFYYWRSSGKGNEEVFSWGGSTVGLAASFCHYDRATLKAVPSAAAARGATWNFFGIRDGNALAVGLESPRNDWHLVLFIPFPN